MTETRNSALRLIHSFSEDLNVSLVFPKVCFYAKMIKMDTIYIVGNASPSQFEAHVGLFRLLMKGIFDPYVL